MNVHEIYGRMGLKMRNNRLNFGDDLDSNLDPEILFLFHLFALCKIMLHVLH